jgi:hypothetical protein
MSGLTIHDPARHFKWSSLMQILASAIDHFLGHSSIPNTQRVKPRTNSLIFGLDMMASTHQCYSKDGNGVVWINVDVYRIRMTVSKLTVDSNGSLSNI